MRKEIIKKCNLYFDKFFVHAEDYEFWVRAMNFTRLANLPEVLLNYRITDAQVTSMFREKQVMAAARVRVRQLNNLGISPSVDEKKVHESIMINDFRDSDAHLSDVFYWLLKIRRANKHLMRYAEPCFSFRLLKSLIKMALASFCRLAFCKAKTDC